MNIDSLLRDIVASLINHTTVRLLGCAFLLIAFADIAGAVAPSLSAEESVYGFHQEGTNSLSVYSVKISIHGYYTAASPEKYTVESIFLQHGPSGAVTVNDVVAFSVTNPDAHFEVQSKPIIIPHPPAVVKGKPKPLPLAPWQVDPRAGFVVIMMKDGKPVAQTYSNNLVEQACKMQPEILQHVSQLSGSLIDGNTLVKK